MAMGMTGWKEVIAALGVVLSLVFVALRFGRTRGLSRLRYAMIWLRHLGSTCSRRRQALS